MSVEPLTLAATKDLLDSLGHDPRKWMGQNFLVEPHVVRRSLELGKVSPGDRVIEVGPGLGTLTGSLLSAGAHVWAVEMDPGLATHLRKTFAAPLPFHLTIGDAVLHPLARIPDPADGNFKVIANLPYAISSAWMEAVCKGPHPSLMVLMLQAETAERLTAETGTRHVSALTVQVDLAFRKVGMHPVSARSFHPAPRVDSCLLVLERRADARRLGPVARKVARALFTQRRKQVGGSSRNLFPGDPVVAAWVDSLGRWGLDSKARPEDLPSAAWETLDLTT